LRDLTEPGAGSASPNEPMKLTWLTRDMPPCLPDRSGERKESPEQQMKRVNRLPI
jgi:hypothetical protein